MKILLPVNGSPASIAAVLHATTLVRNGLRARFVLANVQAPPTLYEVVVAHDVDVISAIASDAGAHQLATAQAMLSGANLPFDTEIASGEAGPMLIDLLENHGCDAVVMGATDADDAETGVGHTALYVLRHSPVPVTVVHPKTHEAD